MNKRCLKLSVVCYTLMNLLFVDVFSLQSPGNPACRLNFTAYPYKPIGGCPHTQEKLQDWNGFPKTPCCENALLVYTHALAQEAAQDPSRPIFLPPAQWADCSGPFPLQPSMSAQACGFNEFYYGNGKCSMLTLSSVDKKVVEQCARFGGTLFDDACGSCTSAISGEVGRLVGGLVVGVEEVVCRVAVVVAVVAGTVNGTDGSGGDDLVRCLPALADTSASENYIKITNSAAESLLSLTLLLLGLTTVSLLIRHATRKQTKEKKQVLTKELATKCSGLYRFAKTEIESAMNFAAERTVLGRGSAGQVYKGMLPSGQPVAIKQLYRSNTSESFVREIDGLSRVRHPNLVCLFGCCIADGQQFLVYEFCPKGNLAQHLLNKECVLTWELRVQILRDCAAALKHLHFHTSGCIVHRDIKLTNILLSHDMEPKLSDFGLSKLMGIEESKVFTDVRGTIGYLDPEYMTNAKLTCASDIYSFGIVTLQLLSGQRVIDLDLNARDQLLRKAKDVSMGKRPVKDFQDARMKGKPNSMDFESILQLAILCAAGSSSGRPTIDLVFEELDRVWKNTQPQTIAKKEKKLLASTPAELICV